MAEEMEAIHAAMGKMGAATGELIAQRILAGTMSSREDLETYFREHGFPSYEAEWRARTVRGAVLAVTEKISALSAELSEAEETVRKHLGDAKAQKKHVNR